jgi:hypothetical protein
MFSGMRSRFSYANVVATLALVFAMSGGALAASKYLITSTKQIKPSVLASLRGKAGANGAAGAQGPAGPAGGVGPTGPGGTPGATGAPGPEGKEGKAGRNGVNGKEGSPWTDKGTLPEGASETGTWAFGELAATTAAEKLSSIRPKIPISFTMPLAVQKCELPFGEFTEHAICADHVHIFEGTTIPAGCTGKISNGVFVTELKGEPGNLCIWINEARGVTAKDLTTLDLENSEVGAGRTGAILASEVELGERSVAEGTWAVTG